MTDQPRPQGQLDVQRWLGRCMLRLQQYERLMKLLLAHHELAGPADRLEAQRAANLEKVSDKTLGTLVKSLFESYAVPDGFERELLPEDKVPTDRISMAISYRMTMAPERLAEARAQIEELVVMRNELVHRAFDVRNIEERQHDDEQVKFGFLMPDGRAIWEPDNLERYPESWLEERADGEWRIKSGQRKFVPQPVKVRPDGVVATDQGLQAWFIPGSFRFCLACGVTHSSAGKDSLRLTSLSAEGRSSATTMLTLSALRYLYEQDQQLSAEAKKVLGFSDNRQDAALQAGHFNDFLQVLLTRAALLSAAQKAGSNPLTEREVANAVFEALGFHRDDPAVRAEYMQQPELKGISRAAESGKFPTVLDLQAFSGHRDIRSLSRYTHLCAGAISALSTLRVHEPDGWPTGLPGQGNGHQL